MNFEQNENDLKDIEMLEFIIKYADELVNKFFEIDEHYFTIDIRFTNRYTGKENIYEMDNIKAKDIKEKLQGGKK